MDMDSQPQATRAISTTTAVSFPERFSLRVFTGSLVCLVFAHGLVYPSVPAPRMSWFLFCLRFALSVQTIVGCPPAKYSSTLYSAWLLAHEMAWIISALLNREAYGVGPAVCVAFGTLLGFVAFYVAAIALSPKDLEEKTGILGVLFKVNTDQPSETVCWISRRKPAATSRLPPYTRHRTRRARGELGGRSGQSSTFTPTALGPSTPTASLLGSGVRFVCGAPTSVACGWLSLSSGRGVGAPSASTPLCRVPVPVAKPKPPSAPGNAGTGAGAVLARSLPASDSGSGADCFGSGASHAPPPCPLPLPRSRPSPPPLRGISSPNRPAPGVNSSDPPPPSCLHPVDIALAIARGSIPNSISNLDSDFHFDLQRRRCARRGLERIPAVRSLE
ncbi:hypothetical protein K438DRAFT_1961364 [Mycena galopus ATCC 62051]|nr:hypothetical protein K438DRAFT_1961364 [Mycena galopus ATCC 62051]